MNSLRNIVTVTVIVIGSLSLGSAGSGCLKRSRCATDYDCKGERICDDGWCRWPSDSPSDTEHDPNMPYDPLDDPPDESQPEIPDTEVWRDPDVECCDCCGSDECCDCCGRLLCCECLSGPCPLECPRCECSPENPSGDCPPGYACRNGECVWLCGNGVRNDGEECDDGNLELEGCECNEPTCVVCGPECRWVEVEVSFPDTIFAVAELSILEYAFSFWDSWIHDAILLEIETCELPESATWRVEKVELLVLLTDEQIRAFPQGIQLGVEVFDGTRPDVLTPYTAIQTFDPESLDWSRYYLSDGQSYYGSWWTFYFEDIIPEGGLNSTSIIVGVWWLNGDLPIGYSNYDLDCERNWSVFFGGSWEQNTEHGQNCAWPYMTVYYRGDR